MIINADNIPVRNMAKIIIYVYTLMFCYHVKGQVLKNEFAFNFGPTITSFYGNPDLKDFKPRMTYSVGVTYGYYCSENFLIQSGIFFERKGAKVGVDYFDNNGNYYQTSDITFNREYLVVPVTCSLVTHTRIKFYFGGGLFLGYLLSANDINTKVFPKETFAAETPRFDFGISFGFGFLIPLNNRFNLDFGIKDNLSVYNTLKNELATRNNSIGLQMGLKYKF